MSSAALDTVRAGIDAFNRGDLDAALADTLPDVELHVFLTPETEVARGHAEVRQMWDERREIFERFRVEADDLVEVGTCVIAIGHLVGAPAPGSPEISMPIAQVYRLQDGLLREVRSFRERDDAIAYANSVSG
jgi:ketosteroid isomerase-like protein